MKRQNLYTIIFALTLISLIFIGYVLYQNQFSKIEPTVCPADVKVCSDGTNVSRTSPECTFPDCTPIINEDNRHIIIDSPEPHSTIHSPD